MESYFIATCVLLTFMIWDIVVTNCVKVSSCLPKGLFALNALTVMILGYVDIERGNSFDPSDRNYLELLVANQLRMDAARLTMCVFVGCSLPRIGMVGTQKIWSSLAALFAGLSFHVASEIYALRNENNSRVEKEAGPWFVSSGVLLSLAALSLLLLSGAVLLTGQMGRRLVRYDISEKTFKDAENEGNRSETLIRKVGMSWMRVYFRKTEYFAWNSAFSPGAGMVVTICVVVMITKVVCRSSLLHHNSGEGNLTFWLQCTFILVGWILMLWRWFKAALYCGNSLDKGLFIHIARSYLAPALIVINLLCPRLVLRVASFLVNREFTWRNILISLFCLVVLLPLCVFILGVGLLWLFCFMSWYISALIFGSQFVQDFFKLDKKGLLRNEKYSRYRSIMDGMEQNTEMDRMEQNEEIEQNKEMEQIKEKSDFFWKVNEKSLHGINLIVSEFREIEKRCKGLISIMGDNKLAENQRLRLCDRNKREWMEAVLSIFSAIADAEIDVDLRDALAAYRETQDVLRFVDYPSRLLLDPLNIFRTMNFHSFFKNRSYRRKLSYVERKLERASERVERELTTDESGKVNDLLTNLNRLGEDMFNSRLLHQLNYNNTEELGGDLRKLVVRVIVSCLLEASGVLLKCTKQWAQIKDEAVGIGLAAKVSAIIETLVEDRDIRSEETRQVPSQSGARASDEYLLEAAWEWCSTKSS